MGLLIFLLPFRYILRVYYSYEKTTHRDNYY